MRARFSREHILLAAAIATIIAALIAVIALFHPFDGSQPVVGTSTPTSTPPTASTSVSTPTPTAPTATTPPAQIVGLSSLAGQLSWKPSEGPPSTYETSGGQSVGTGEQVGTVNIGGRPRTDAISNRIYYDNTNFPLARIQTDGKYRAMTGIVGLNDATECPRNTAIVHVENETGQTLWGPRTVSIDHPITLSVPLRGAIQVNLLQVVTRSNPSASDCDAGDADPAWGDIHFVG
jgi:hypothetical protein